MTKIISVAGFKGGCGKSTTAVHLAVFLAEHGSTLLVDGDRNRTAIDWAARGGDRFPVEVVDERGAIRAASGRDFVVIDTAAAPDSNDLAELANGCDLLVLPSTPDVVSIQPTIRTAQSVDVSNYRVLLTIVPPRPSKEGEQMRAGLIEAEVPVFKTMIRRTAGFQRAALEGVPIRDVSESRLRNGWYDYKALGAEILTILEGSK